MVIDMVILTILAILSEYVGILINPQLFYMFRFAQVFLILISIRWELVFNNTYKYSISCQSTYI